MRSADPEAEKDTYTRISLPCVVVIVLGNGHGDTSSNPGRD